MRFGQDFIDKVRDANDVVEIIGQYTELKGGHRKMGRCPFPDHSDKSPSFSVDEDNQLYYCFGCKKGGNVFTFLESYNGMNFPEAVEYLAKRASIPLPEPDEPQAKARAASREQKDLYFKINKAAGIYFHQTLKAEQADSPARKYLEKRGLNDEIVEKFRLGYATDHWQGLYDRFSATGVPLPKAEELGLFKRKQGGAGSATHYDLFRDRLIFPIFSPTSEVVGFGGRTLGDAMPKYLNSHDSPVFTKGRTLYGLHETGKFIRALDSAIVVEGYMDAIALYAAGIKNVVAILGTAFTPDHAKILKRYSQNVVMLLDGDDAGVGGAERSLPILLSAGMMPKGFLLPEKMDPDDFVKANGADRLREEVARAPELFTLLLTRQWMKGYRGSPSEKVQVVNDAANALLSMTNRQLQDLYLLEMSRQLDIDISWVRKALHETAKERQPRNAPSVETPSAAPTPMGPDESSMLDDGNTVAEKILVKGAPRDEAFILSLLVHHENLMRELVEAGPENLLTLISHEGLRAAIELSVRMFKANPKGFFGLAANLASQVDPPRVVTLSVEAVQGGADGIERKLMTDYLNALRKRTLKSRGRAMVTQMRDGASAATMEEFMALQRDRLTPLKRDDESSI